MAPVTVNPEKIHAFASADAFEAWLRDHHDSETEIWIKIHKLASGLPSIQPKEAIDVALCWGWIDAIRKGHDQTSYLQRFTPRGARSIWSQINVDNVARLVAQGRMTPHGLAHVEAAKADGRWQRAYRISGNELPDDLKSAIAAEPKAQAMLEKLSAQNRFALSFRVLNMKTEAGRRKKIADIVAMLKEGRAFHPQKNG